MPDYVLLYPLPSARDELEPLMLLILDKPAEVLGDIAVDDILLPQLLILIDCHFLQKLQLLHGRCLLLLAQGGFVGPDDESKRFFGLVEYPQFVGVLVVLNLDISKKIFLQSVLHLVRLLILEIGRQPHADHVARFEVDVLREDSVPAGQANVLGRLAVILVLNHARLGVYVLQ